MEKVIKTGKVVRFNGLNYLEEVQTLPGIETEYKGRADDFIPDGSYIEGCDCHPNRSATRYIEVINGDYYESVEDIDLV